MNVNLVDLLQRSDVLLLFTALAFGLLMGRVKLGGIELGATTGVLLVALFLGDRGFDFSVHTESLGFMLFIFCVGIEAGPNFFSTFVQDGVKYIMMAAVVGIGGIVMALTMARLLDLGPGLAAGMLAGSLTSTPTLVGAQDAVNTRLGALDAAARSELIADISVGYAITYVVGLFGLLILIRYLPKLLRVDMAEEARKVAEERGLGQRRRSNRNPIVRAYEVTEKVVAEAGQATLRELGVYERTGCTIGKLKRDGQILEPDSETVLRVGDRVAIVGYPENHAKLELALNRQIYDYDLLDFRIDTQDVIVQHNFAVGKQLKDLEMEKRYGCFVDSLVRSQVEMPVSPSLILSKGDLLAISGERNGLQSLADKIGSINLRSEVSDLVSFSFFFIVGLILGQFTVTLGALEVGLGNAGGLLFAGIVMGYFRAARPGFGHVPQGALNILKDLGLNIFMVSIGLKAGAGIVESLLTLGPSVVIAGLAIMIVPVAIGYAFGVYVLKMNAALLLGAITGSMTSTPALGIVTDAARSNIPALGYAGTYTFANVFLTVAGAVIVTVTAG